MSETRINVFPPQRRGLWRVKAEPYLWKDRWPEAPFGARWRRIKAKQRGPAPGPRRPCERGAAVKPRLLDAFSGAGGAARGYQMAGFHVTGVDVRPQPRYAGDAFVLGDALEYIREHGREFDAIHASPPCQAFTQMSARWRGKGGPTDDHLDLLTPTRALLATFSCPWIIENVQGARNHMQATVVLHGGMFGLGVHRPRLFESNMLLTAPQGTPRTLFPIGVYGTHPDGRTTYRYRNNGNMKGKSLIRAAKSIKEAREAMGIDWMDWNEIKEAVPPSYTEYLGRQLLAAILPLEAAR